MANIGSTLSKYVGASELSNLLESDKFGIISVKTYGAVGDGVTDDTAAWDAMVATAPEGSKIIFPKGTYLGNFVATKSFDIDFCGSTLVPAEDSLPTFKFEGSVGTGLTVTGNPAYGDTSFVVSSVSGLIVGDIGVLHDEAVRPSDSAEVNYELIKIKAIDTDTKTITVCDMIRSDQNTGTCKFYPITKIINPTISNLNVECSDTHLYPAAWFYGCENPIAKNVQTENTTGHAVRFEYSYNPFAENIKFLYPYSTDSGEGYGLTFQKCRYGYGLNIYGNGMRHLVDMESAYCCHVEKVCEDDGQSSVIVLSHNGYGGNNSVNNAVVTADIYAVEWASQGITDLDKVTARDIKITNINHVIPTKLTTDFNVSIYVIPDFSNLIIDNVTLTYIDTSATPDTDSYCVRLNGNQLGDCVIKNIRANEAGTVVAYNRRSTRTYKRYNFTIDNINVDSCVYAVYLRGFDTVNIDNIYCDSAITSVFYLSNLASVTPHGASFGKNIQSNINNTLITYSGLPSVGLRGNPIKITDKSTTSVTVATTDTIITQSAIMNSGGYLQLTTPVGGDGTLNTTTPIEAPLWIGQELVLVINNAGYTGTRGNVIIPSGSDTYADDGAPVTLTKANIYQLIGYNGKWRVIS